MTELREELKAKEADMARVLSPATRRLTITELLDRRIIQLEAEIRGLVKLRDGLPREMHYEADQALFNLLRFDR